MAEFSRSEWPCWFYDRWYMLVSLFLLYLCLRVVFNSCLIRNLPSSFPTLHLKSSLSAKPASRAGSKKLASKVRLVSIISYTYLLHLSFSEMYPLFLPPTLISTSNYLSTQADGEPPCGGGGWVSRDAHGQPYISVKWITPETLLMIKVQNRYLHLYYLYYIYMVCAHYLYVCM